MNELYDIPDGLTRQSGTEYINLRRGYMSAEEAYNYLLQLDTRSFSEILCNLFNGSKEDLRERLITGFTGPSDNRESIARKIRGWLSDSYAPAERTDFFRICFILNLSEEKSKQFVTAATGEDFHIRDVSECAFLYAIRIGADYDYACKLKNMAKDMLDNISYYQDDSGLNESPISHALSQNEESPRTMYYTGSLREPFQEVKTEEDFFRYIQTYASVFGTIHNTAYSHFVRLMDLLMLPDTDNEERYSVDTVVDIYLRLGVPVERVTSKYQVIQKTIKKYWPNVTSIARMRNRTEDISRRVLLLLYVITEGGVSGMDEDAYLLDEDLSDTERFEEHYCKLNSLLHDCGMAYLDPRNTFDWLIIFSLRSDEDTPMSEKIEKTLRIIFAETE